jgi:hypothetical protein
MSNDSEAIQDSHIFAYLQQQVGALKESRNQGSIRIEGGLLAVVASTI